MQSYSTSQQNTNSYFKYYFLIKEKLESEKSKSLWQSLKVLRLSSKKDKASSGNIGLK